MLDCPLRCRAPAVSARPVSRYRRDMLVVARSRESVLTGPGIPTQVVPVGNSILLATDIESGDAPALCQGSVA